MEIRDKNIYKEEEKTYIQQKSRNFWACFSEKCGKMVV